MATKRKSAKRQSPTRRVVGVAQSAIARIEAELPASLRDYVEQVEAQLNRLETRIEKAGASARRQATRLLRDASKQLGSLEERGEAAWGRLAGRYRADVVALLDRLEAAIAPPRAAKKARPRRAARKKAAR